MVDQDGARRAGIVTPEAVLLELEPAGIGSRLLAKVLDVLVQGGALLVLAMGVGLVLSQADAPTWLAVVLFLFAFFAILFLYPVVLETRDGRTIGKRALRLRVVTREGGPARFRHAAIRAALGLVEFIVVPGGILAVLSTLFSRDSQRLGDLAAGTLVVRDRSAQPPAGAVWFPIPVGFEAYAASLDTTLVDVATYGLVRRFLLRAPTLSPGARQQLALRLANPLAQRMRHTPPPGASPEVFLICLVASYQRRHATP
jgi:uncharacterized RDD family membrane protein YckC